MCGRTLALSFSDFPSFLPLIEMLLCALNRCRSCVREFPLVETGAEVSSTPSGGANRRWNISLSPEAYIRYRDSMNAQ